MLDIPGYRILGTIRATGSSVLFHAVREADGLPVIIKTPMTPSPGPSERERYRRELAILQRLRNVRGVAKPYACEQLRERPVLLLERVHGETLSESSTRTSSPPTSSWSPRVLSALRVFEDAFKLQKLLLTVSSFADASFQFPEMAQFNRPALGTKKLALPSQASGVIAGLMVFAEWQLQTGDRQHNLLMKLLGLGATQSAALAVGADPLKDSRLYVSQRTTFQGHPFVCQFGAELSNGKPSLFLTGTLTARIQDQPQTFDVTMAFAPGGAFLSGTMKGATGVNCGPFKLSNLALEIGVDWAGIPSLGIAATIDVKKFESSVAVFFDSTDPSHSLVAGSISSVTLKEVVDGLVGGTTPLDGVLSTIAVKGTHEFLIPGNLASDLDGLSFDKVSAAFSSSGKIQIPSSSSQLLLVVNQKGSVWHLTDLTTMRHYELKKRGDQIAVSIAPQFYFAPQATSIGTIRFPQGFYINAALSFAGFDVSATIDISQNKGVAVDAQMDKIVILDEKVFSIAAMQGGGGPKISISTFSQPGEPVAQFRQPHFYINGSLTMMGVKEGIFASVSTQGIDFELNGQLLPGVKFDLDARFGGGGIGANGTVKVGVGTVDLGPLGKAKINTDVEVKVDIDIDKGTAAKDVTIKPGGSYAVNTTLLENELGKLVFQGDGNLVLYKKEGSQQTAAWASNTNGRGGAKVAFQGDGNLVVYTSKNAPIWASNTAGQAIARLTLQADGNLVIYDNAGKPRWASGTHVDTGRASIEMESSFDFAGQHVSIARFKLEAKADTFTKLPDIISKKVEDALRDVFKDATKWANAVGDGFMDGVNDTSKVLQSVYGQSEKEAKDLANSVNKGMNQAGKAISNTAKSAEKTATKTIKKMKFW